MSRRDQITMTGEEVEDLLDQQRVVMCATIGPRGWPHVMPLWYVLCESEVWAWTYARSQKVRNLDRDPRATLQFEDGERYEELRGVMIETNVVLHRETEVVAGSGRDILSRYGGGSVGAGFLEAIRAQATKRVALQFASARIAMWDHRKLGRGGIY